MESGPAYGNGLFSKPSPSLSLSLCEAEGNECIPSIPTLKRLNDPRKIGSVIEPLGHFFRLTTDASTLHPNDPALKVVCRQTVGRRAYATNVRRFSRLGEPNFVGPQALNLLCQQVV